MNIEKIKLKVVEAIDNILTPLEVELDDLRTEVNKGQGGTRKWERSLQRFDEVLLMKYQTQLVKDAVCKVFDKELIIEEIENEKTNSDMLVSGCNSNQSRKKRISDKDAKVV